MTPKDQRLHTVEHYHDVFVSTVRVTANKIDQISKEQVSAVNVNQLFGRTVGAVANNALNREDFIRHPKEQLGCLGLALSLFYTAKSSLIGLPRLLTVYPRVSPFIPMTCFDELKSGVVGQLVTLVGNVIRISCSHQLVETATFRCGLCQGHTIVPFEDGLFAPPTSCQSSKRYVC